MLFQGWFPKGKEEVPFGIVLLAKPKPLSLDIRLEQQKSDLLAIRTRR